MAETLHQMAKRMCKGRVCGECPLRLWAQPCLKTILEGRPGFDGAVDALRAWAAANPVKSYKDDFFEKFPRAERDADGYPPLWVTRVYGITRLDAPTCAGFRGAWDAPLGTWGEKEDGDS